jgi:hypothetical protein
MADQAVDPVTNPLASLQAMAAQRLPARMEMQDAQLENLQQIATRSPESEENERYASMASAAAQVPPMVGNFGALLANIGGAYGKTLAQQNRQAFADQVTIAKQMDASNLYRSMGSAGKSGVGSTGKFVPVNGVEGLMVNNITKETLDLRDAAALKQVQSLVKAIRDDYPTEADALQAALAIQAKTGGRQPTSETPVPTGVKSSPIADMKPAGALDTLVPGEEPKPLGQSDKTRWVGNLKRQMDEAAATGDFAKALQLQTALSELKAQPASEGAQMPARKDIIAEAGAKAKAEAQSKADVELATVKQKESEKELGQGSAKVTLEQPKALTSLNMATSKIDEFKDAVKELANHPGVNSALGWSSVVPLYGQNMPRPGGDTADFMAKAQVLLSKTAQSTLQEIRDASKTGGALGNVSDKDVSLLQNSLAAIAPDPTTGKFNQSEKMFKKELTTVVTVLDRMRKQALEGYQRQYGKPEFSIRPKEEAPSTNKFNGFSIRPKD